MKQKLWDFFCKEIKNLQHFWSQFLPAAELKKNFFSFQFHGAPLYFTDILSYFNLVFTLLFTIECIFKLVSFGPRVRLASISSFSLWGKKSSNKNDNFIHLIMFYDKFKNIFWNYSKFFNEVIMIWQTQIFNLFWLSIQGTLI
jgi:hypothetical protein